MFGGTGRSGAYQSIGLGVTTDAVYSAGFGGGTGDLKLTEAWGIRGAFNHNWDPYWSTSLWGSYAQVRYNGGATAPPPRVLFCARFNCWQDGKLRTIAVTRTSTSAQIGVVTRWTPVKNLTFSAEVVCVPPRPEDHG